MQIAYQGFFGSLQPNAIRSPLASNRIVIAHENNDGQGSNDESNKGSSNSEDRAM